MRPAPKFQHLDKSFWASVRSLSQEIGYTARGTGRIKIPTLMEMRSGFEKLNLEPAAIADERGVATKLGRMLSEYFTYRANLLVNDVQLLLMDASAAKALFDQYRRELRPTCPLPMNKQKGTKKAPAYMTGLVNMLIDHHSKKSACDYDPRKLTTITHNRVPLRTLARRVDGAFPNTINPVAVWEVKEYYYTTTFGSRVADGVYESLLDGMELEELRESHDVDVRHYLFVDAKKTWWNDGKAYLCRLIDMLNMGYVDEVLFGREVVKEMPRIVSEWRKLVKARQKRGAADAPSQA